MPDSLYASYLAVGCELGYAVFTGGPDLVVAAVALAACIHLRSRMSKSPQAYQAFLDWIHFFAWQFLMSFTGGIGVNLYTYFQCGRSLPAGPAGLRKCPAGLNYCTVARQVHSFTSTATNISLCLAFFDARIPHLKHLLVVIPCYAVLVLAVQKSYVEGAPYATWVDAQIPSENITFALLLPCSLMAYIIGRAQFYVIAVPVGAALLPMPIGFAHWNVLFLIGMFWLLLSFLVHPRTSVTQTMH